uniref:Progestin and adipoQ receptor family member 6 n=1 Tax=Callorhinchus milii TaxID=7868 RepID=A0A4W3GSR3_CALMI
MLTVKLPQLLSIHQVPKVFQEKGIISGYRHPKSSAMDCILSTFQMTNETLNIWTHFLPTWYGLAFVCARVGVRACARVWARARARVFQLQDPHTHAFDPWHLPTSLTSATFARLAPTSCSSLEALRPTFSPSSAILK